MTLVLLADVILLKFFVEIQTEQRTLSKSDFEALRFKLHDANVQFLIQYHSC